MPARQLFPGQETLEVKIRLPAPTVRAMDAQSPGQRSRTVATALDDFFERAKDDLERVAQRMEERAALKVLAKERNDAEDALRRMQVELREERKKLQSLLKSVQMTIRNFGTADGHRLAGLMRRVRSQMLANEQESEDVTAQLQRLKGGS